MKLAIVSAQPTMLEQVRAFLLQPGESALGLSLHMGGVESAARIAEQVRPDILLVGGERHDLGELAALEPLTARHPAPAVMLVSANQSAEFLREAMRIGLREVLPEPVSREALLDAIGRVRKRYASQPARRS